MNSFAVGYSDGSIRIWEMEGREPRVTFHGHKSAVSTLTWDETGARLASGSRDCDIIVWDVLAESGLHRLRGHTNGITQVCFVGPVLISVSRDTFVKVWDLATQHCFETIVTHRSEITAMLYDKNESLLITFGADQQIYIFKANLDLVPQILAVGMEMESNLKVFEQVEVVERSYKERVLSVCERDEYLCVLAADKSVEVFRMNFRSAEKKAQSAKKMLSSVHHSRFSEKPISMDISRSFNIAKNNVVKIVMNFTNNSVQEWSLPLDKQSEKEKLHAVEFCGHRSDIKAVTMSSDGSMMASVSGECVKIWNMASGSCIRTLLIEDGLVACFVPGDKNIMVATKTGMINIFELVSGNCIIAVEAHEGALWSLHLAPDKKGFVTGGADKTVKFWEFKKDKATGKLSKVKHIKTLQLSDEVLVVKYSPDMRLLAVALLDMTVKVFFEDSLKLSLSLYGHKLPVTALDISNDSTTIVTVSSDKNIKIWSLQFGDCRKSIFAHQEAITFVSFLGRGSEFITASKDKTVRYWDANKFIALQKLNGHHAEIWATAVNQTGDVIVTAAHDKSIRIWSKTEELLFPDEEKEKEMDELINETILADASKEEGEDGLALPSKATLASMKAGERIVEAIEVADIETSKARDAAIAKENGIDLELQAPEPLLLAAGKGKTPAELVHWAISQVPLTELEESLLTVPTSMIPSLLSYVIQWFENRLNIVVACRVLELILKVYHSQIISNTNLRLQLQKLKELQTTQLKEYKDILGYNIALMRTIIAK